MTKTQIQVPEELYAELKGFAKRREWSLAETFRRGAELLLETYPEGDSKVSAPWGASFLWASRLEGVVRGTNS